MMLLPTLGAGIITDRQGDQAEARPRKKIVNRRAIRPRTPKAPATAANIPLPQRAPEATPATATAQPLPDATQTVAPHVTPTAAAAHNAPPAHGARPDPPPPSPQAELAERTRTILDRHCARCHQTGTSQPSAEPDGGIANILNLAETARNPQLVRPGEPDASPLYQQMIARQMPPDILRHGKEGPAPDAAEIRTVRAWISGLGATTSPGACPERQPIAAPALATTLSQWLSAIGPERAADTRFVSLAHLFNTCASDATLAAHRQAVAKIFNSLTWSEKPVALDAIGDSLALLAVRLSDLGWTPEHWATLTRELPAAARFDLPAAVISQTNTEVPLITGDWLAHTAMQPELYARLLGLPSTLDGLTRILGLDLDGSRQNRSVRRAITTQSTITPGPRVIERYKSTHGALWIAHDYAPPRSTAILDMPLLPWAAESGKHEPEALPTLLGSRALFTLPNGLPAFMMFDADGHIQYSRSIAASEPDRPGGAPQAPANAAPDADDAASKGNQTPSTTSPPLPTPAPDAARRGAALAHPTHAGLACAGCHALGPQPFTDSLYEHLSSGDYAGNPEARVLARRTAVSRPELAAFIKDDRFAVRRTLAAIGIDADRTEHTPSLVRSLADRHVRDIDIHGAAAELLTNASQLTPLLTRLSDTASPLAPLAIRLALGRITRAEFEILRPALVKGTTRPGVVASLNTAQPAATPSSPSARPRAAGEARAHNPLELWPDKISYARDDRIVLSVRTAHSCHLTLVNIDNTGSATVLFPNEFARDNLIRAGETKQIPAADALFHFRLQHPGAETFVAICEEGEPVPAGMSPSLTQMNFTALGNWAEFLDKSVQAASEPRVPLTNGDDIDRRRRRGQGPELRPAPRTSPLQSRAAVTVTIAP